MTPADEIARVASGLTKAQRETLLNLWAKASDIGEHHIWPYTHARCRAALQDKGLVEPRMYATRLTPLGLAVRDFLREQGR